MVEQQDNRENIKEITTIEELAANGVKKPTRKRVRVVRVKNPLAEEEAIKADDTHAD